MKHFVDKDCVLSDDYSITRVIVYLFLVVIASTPLLLLSEISAGGLVFLLCFLIPIQLICLNGIIGRRVVSIDSYNKLLVVKRYMFGLGRQQYDLCDFTKISVSESRIVRTSSADNFNAPSGHERGNVNISKVFLHGISVVELAEFRYDFDDSVSKRKVDDFVIQCIEKLESIGFKIEY